MGNRITFLHSISTVNGKNFLHYYTTYLVGSETSMFRYMYYINWLTDYLIGSYVCFVFRCTCFVSGNSYSQNSVLRPLSTANHSIYHLKHASSPSQSLWWCTWFVGKLSRCICACMLETVLFVIQIRYFTRVQDICSSFSVTATILSRIYEIYIAKYKLFFFRLCAFKFVYKLGMFP